MAIVKTIWEGLGKTPQKRVRNFCVIIATISAAIVVNLNLKCGYNSKGDCHCPGWWFEWNPAADIEIKKGISQ